MIGDEPTWVPACIIASWGSIFYAAVITVRQLPLGWFARPLVVGLLGVALDFACDPVVAASSVLEAGRDFWA